MQCISLEGNSQRLDGGAMFGNCPRNVWASWCPPDEENRIPLACRALLVREPQGRTILFEAGVGAFFDARMRERYGVVESDHRLLRSLSQAGVAPEAIDVVVLSHLHFDHAGGILTAWREGEEPGLVFPNAQYVVSDEAWRRAESPHPRDRASFIPGLTKQIEATGKLECVSGDTSSTLGSGYDFRYSQGHTPGLMLTRIEAAQPGPITFVGDLIPGTPWIHAPITMGYDRYPELLIEEKSALLAEIEADNEWIFMPHDPKVAACRIARDERGRFQARDPRDALNC
jgi:glyoxylase-like metal-dependent hydrolase (beta-lactamase superfamily II)